MVYDIETIKEKTIPIAEKYGVKRMSLFGSYARGEADDKSDVDILIERGKLTGFAYGGFISELQRALKCHVDVVSKDNNDQDFVLKKTRYFYMRDKFFKNKTTLERMLGYCADVEELLKKFDYSFESYLHEIIFQYSCNMCILQIGELTTRLSQDFKATHPEISWHDIKATRNISVHEYDRVNFNVIWDILNHDIPILREQLAKILEEEFKSSDEN